MVCPPSPKGLVSPCLPLSPLVSPLDCVSAFPRVLSPLLSPCAPSCSLCWMVCPPSRGSSLPFCLPLCPFLFPFVGCPPSRGSCLPLCPLVSPCLTSYSPSSVLLGVLTAFLRCPPWCWMVCLPSRGSCLPSCQLLFPFVGWCVRLPEGLVSPCLPLSALLSPLVSNCTPFCFPLLDVPLPEGLVSPCLPSCSLSSVLLGVLNTFLRCPPWCWMVCPPSRGSCLPVSLIVPLLVFSCWMACPLFQGSSLALSPIVPFLFPFVGWCVHLTGGLVSLQLSPIGSLCSGYTYTVVWVGGLEAWEIRVMLKIDGKRC